MSENEGPGKMLIVVAIVGVGILCGLGGMLGAGLFFYSSAQREEVEQARAAALAEQEERHRAWLNTLPTDERTAIETFDRAEQVATELVRAIAEARADETLPDSLGAIVLRLEGTGKAIRELSSPRAESTEADDGRTIAVDVEVVIVWEDDTTMRVLVTLDRAAEGTLTASAIELIVDAVDEE